MHDVDLPLHCKIYTTLQDTGCVRGPQKPEWGMVKIKAAEAETSWHLVSGADQAPESPDATLPDMHRDGRGVVINVFASSLSWGNLWWHHQAFFFFSEASHQSHRRHYTTDFFFCFVFSHSLSHTSYDWLKMERWRQLDLLQSLISLFQTNRSSIHLVGGELCCSEGTLWAQFTLWEVEIHQPAPESTPPTESISTTGTHSHRSVWGPPSSSR